MSESVSYSLEYLHNIFDLVVPISKDFKRLNVQKLLSNFHFHEIYDPNKEYTKRMFKANYDDRGVHQYEYVLVILTDSCIFYSKERYYVIAKEKLTNEETQYLSEYCQCDYHMLSNYNPIRLMVTRHSSRCIGSGNPSQSVIDKTRIYMNKNDHKFSD